MTTSRRRTSSVLVGLLAAAVLAPATTLAWTECLVLTTDYVSTGSACSLERHDPWTIVTDLETTGNDPVGRWHEGLYYVVNRSGSDNIQILDPEAGYQTVSQFSTGVGTNPQDIAFDRAGEAYVSCYDQAVLLKVDPEAGTILDSWPTDQFADADGMPETAWMYYVSDRLYISCQRLDRDFYYSPTDASYLLVFDTVAEAWVDVDPDTPDIQGILLEGLNPYTAIELDEHQTLLRVGCNGFYGVLDGGVEVVDFMALESLGFEITEEELGGDLIDLVTVSDQQRYVIVSDTANFATSLRYYDPTAGDVVVVDQSAVWSYLDVTFEGRDLLYLADRTPGDHGIRVFAAVSGDELTSGPIPAGLPPAWVVLPEPLLTPVPEVTAASVALEPVWPNPCNPGAEITLQSAPGQTVALSIVDLRGRRVRTAQVVTDGNGTGRFHFDGKDDRGLPVATGVYRVVANLPGTQGGVASRTMTVVK